MNDVLDTVKVRRASMHWLALLVLLLFTAGLTAMVGYVAIHVPAEQAWETLPIAGIGIVLQYCIVIPITVQWVRDTFYC